MLRGRVAVLTAVAIVSLPGIQPALADERVPFTLEVEDASAEVGEEARLKAMITAPEGFSFTKVYRHRIIDLSAEDGGVEFKDEVVQGSIEDGALVFEIPVTPTTAGEHPINGIIRVSFNHGNTIESKSVPLMGTVTGTQ